MSWRRKATDKVTSRLTALLKWIDHRLPQVEMGLGQAPETPIIGTYPDGSPLRAPMRNLRSHSADEEPAPPQGKTDFAPPAPERPAGPSPYDRPIEDVVMTGPRPVHPGVYFMHDEIAELVEAKPQARRVYTVEDEEVMALLVLDDGSRGRPGYYPHGLLGQPLYVGPGHAWQARRYAEAWNIGLPHDQVEVIALDDMLRIAHQRGQLVHKVAPEQ